MEGAVAEPRTQRQYAGARSEGPAVCRPGREAGIDYGVKMSTEGAAQAQSHHAKGILGVLLIGHMGCPYRGQPDAWTRDLRIASGP